MRNDTAFKFFYDEASRLAEEMAIAIALLHLRMVTRRLDEHHENRSLHRAVN